MPTPFTITSAEGLPIRGDFDAPDKPRALVIVVHGFKGFKDWGFFPWLAQRLAGHRLAVCRFNMSRCGIGDDPESFDRLDLFERDTYSIELADLRSVIRFAQLQFPGLPTILLGHSRGGGIAILGAQEVADLAGVIAWSPISRCDNWEAATLEDFAKRGFTAVMNQRTKQVMRIARDVLDDFEANREQLDIERAAQNLQAPLLVIHGARDESVPLSSGQLLASRAADGSLIVIGTATHTFNAIHPLVHVPVELVLAAEASAHFAVMHA
ncbi:MAG TPA: alpha/beta fold hydrolase [Thermoanaerobaculia bacterium]|nr:alpha/beta fold hydrolase [Thermoanaerobaculia bacterium]